MCAHSCYMHVHLHARAHTHTHRHAYTCTHAHTHTHTHKQTYTQRHTHTHTYTLPKRTRQRWVIRCWDMFCNRAASTLYVCWDLWWDRRPSTRSSRSIFWRRPTSSMGSSWTTSPNSSWEFLLSGVHSVWMNVVVFILIVMLLSLVLAFYNKFLLWLQIDNFHPCHCSLVYCQAVYCLRKVLSLKKNCTFCNV